MGEGRSLPVDEKVTEAISATYAALRWSVDNPYYNWSSFMDEHLDSEGMRTGLRELFEEQHREKKQAQESGGSDDEVDSETGSREADSEATRREIRSED